MTNLRRVISIMTQLEEDLYNILKADTTPIIERAQMLHIFFVQMLKHGIYKHRWISYHMQRKTILLWIPCVILQLIQFDMTHV